MTINTELKPGEIATYSGRAINPLDPDPEAITLEDIGHALSNQCRFTGHVQKFYSVAEHSVRALNELVDKNFYYPAPEYPPVDVELNLLKWVLLHDASEAYLSDIARPVKNQLGFGEIYKASEDVLMKVIAEKFGMSSEMPEEISRVDDVMLRTEQRDLMNSMGIIPGDEFAVESIETTMSPVDARSAFMALADEVIW